MIAWPRSFFSLARLGLIAVTLAACGTASGHLTPSASVETLMAGWERHFTIDWTVEPEQGGVRRIHGYVSSHHGEYAQDVRVLGQALDSSGAIVGQRVVWMPGDMNGFQRAYFEIPHLPSAARYRVSVWDYTFLQNDGWF